VDLSAKEAHLAQTELELQALADSLKTQEQVLARRMEDLDMNQARLLRREVEIEQKAQQPHCYLLAATLLVVLLLCAFSL
jgi:uncharacterized protein (DUF3084 family)